MVALGVVVATFASECYAIAQPLPASDVLKITVSEGGRTVFDSLIPNLLAVSGLRSTAVVKYTNAMATLREFCEGVGGNSPDIVLTTRRMRPSMATECAKNGVEHMVQVGLGRGALVLAVKKGSALTKLTSRQVYLALARDIPDKEEFRRNAAIRWSDIERTLPQLDIRFLLPPRDDGSRVVFANLVLEGGCREQPAIKLIFSAEQRTARCATMRVDRIREVPRDQAVQALLDAPEGTVGVLSYRDFAQAGDQLVGLEVNGALHRHARRLCKASTITSIFTGCTPSVVRHFGDVPLPSTNVPIISLPIR